MAVFQLTELLQQTHNLHQYVFQYLVFYGVLASSFTYACRFNDDDAAHKILWSAYEFGLLLMLEGAGNETADRPWSLFKVATTGTFILLALGFFGRVAVGLPRARGFAAYFGCVDLVLAGIFLFMCPHDGLSTGLLAAFAAVSLAADAFFVFVLMPCLPDGPQLDIPMNIE